MIEPQKTTIQLLAENAKKESWSTRWEFPLTLWGKTSDVAVTVFDKPQEKFSERTGNAYFIGAELTLPNMSKKIPMFYSDEYKYSSAKIGSEEDQIKVGLYTRWESFKDKWSGRENNTELKEYNLVFKYNVETTTSTEINFWTDVATTEVTTTSPIVVPNWDTENTEAQSIKESMSDLPF